MSNKVYEDVLLHRPAELELAASAHAEVDFLHIALDDGLPGRNGPRESHIVFHSSAVDAFCSRSECIGVGKPEAKPNLFLGVCDGLANILDGEVNLIRDDRCHGFVSLDVDGVDIVVT